MERLSFNLRRQLIVVSLLLLSLPWAGCQFIREMEGAMGQAQERALHATAETVANMVGNRPELIYPDLSRTHAPLDTGRSLHALPADRPVTVDGYAEGWDEVPPATWSAAPDGDLAVSVQSLTYGGNLYLLLRIRDREVTYHHPGLSREPNGDRLVLRTWLNNRRQEYVLATAAPGNLRARAASRRERGVDPGRIWGYWQDATGGYTLEVEIPLELIGERLGFYIVDAGSGENAPASTLGNTSPLAADAPPWLIRTPPALRTALSPFGNQGHSVQLVDRERWVIGELAAPVGASDDADTFWLLRLIYRSILSDESLPYPPETDVAGKFPPGKITSVLDGHPHTWLFRDPDRGNRTLRIIAVPVRHQERVIGAAVVRQSSEQYLSLTDQAFSRLLGYSALAIALGVIGLLAYASLLSFRIKRLSDAAANVIGNDGAISGDFPRSTMADEIGDLSRHYAELLDRLREYNDYLRTLSRKLAHELRTPIAVIQTSLDNLEETAAQPGETGPYLGRARDGLSRLNGILQAMSEASRLEESLAQNPLREFDLLPLLQELQSAYSGVYPEHLIELSADVDRAPVMASPELVVQLMDKLVENAVSFSPETTPVSISLQRVAGGWQLAVSNRGPQLPEDVQNSLFDPMVSSRAADDGEVHLGLGLHIARLISDFLGGKIEACNTTAPAGVRVSLFLPAQ